MLDKQRRTKKKGLVPKVKSPLYKLKLARIEVVFQDEDPSELEIREGRCFLGSEVWGEPCQRSGDSALITLNDVSKQDELFITTGGDLVKDKVTNLRIFAVNVSRIGKARYDIFTWYGRRTDVTVTVDWTQEGDSTDTWTEW
ncbi:hypothetical protein TSMEX_007167 [Taenia solium]